MWESPAVSVDVRPVTGGGDLKAFIDLPFRLHANHPLWVPPLKVERRFFLSRRLNAFFAHGDAEYFLARRDGRVVGRITAHINHNSNRHHGRAWGNFGFVEFEDDPDVVTALLGAAHAWLQARGMERMVGPMDFQMNDECGILVEGFDLRPMIRQPWHPPYYQQRLEEAGLTKAIDLLMWNLEVSDREKVLPILFELADKVEPEHGIRLRKMTRRSLRKDLEVFGAIYNEAWKRNWDFVPYDAKDLDALAQETQLVFDSDWMMVAERIDTGEAVASAMTFPDINQVLTKMNGRLLPFGWLYFLRRARYMDRVRVGWLGVKPEYQHTGVAAKLYVEHFDMAGSTRFSGGEMGWILETNKAMNRGMEAMGGRVVKTYRMYERVF
jgi:GNAT superfamily N-acetyltransferase